VDLVTGGTGFVGAHLVRALMAKGRAVRCLVRKGSKATNLDGLDVERVEGDLRESDSLVRAVRGCERVFHCAADYRLGAPDPETLHRSNVEGTRNVLQAAKDAGVSKVVYTSSVGALGLTADGTPASETTPVSRDSVVGAYKRSKFDAERVAEEFARGGLPVVIVNPSTPVGELDVKPTPTGQVIVDFLNRKLEGQGLLVRPVRRHGIEGVSHRDDSRDDDERGVHDVECVSAGSAGWNRRVA